MKCIYLLVGLIGVLGALFSPAYGQVKHGTHHNWSLYSTTLQGKKACYIASFAVDKKGDYSYRDDPYLLVTRISNNIYEVSVSSGYKYKHKSDVNVNIEGEKYTMFTQGEYAWAYDSKQDAQMIERMKKKNHMTVRGTSIKGTYSLDKYSLKGFTAAYNEMQSLCKQ